MADADEIDDDPIEVLRDLREEGSPDFFPRLRESIERRVLGAQLVEMGFDSLTEVARQFLAAVFGAGTGGEQKGEPHEQSR